MSVSHVMDGIKKARETAFPAIGFTCPMAAILLILQMIFRTESQKQLDVAPQLRRAQAEKLFYYKII